MSDTQLLEIATQKRLFPFEDGLFPVLFLAPEYQTVEDRLKYVKEFQCRPDDVILCTYPKCGTHWAINLIRRLLRVNDGDTIPRDVRFLEDSHFDYESMLSPRVICTHLRPIKLPQQHLATAGKVVVCLRDPRDAAVSYYHQINNVQSTPGLFKWDTFLENTMAGKVPFGSILDYISEWDRFVSAHEHPNVLVIFYEDLLSSGFETLRKVQAHLGTNKSDECLHQILSECSFKTLQEEASELDARDIWRGFLSRDGKYAIYRKGQIGDWKNLFTVAQSEAFDKLMQEKFQHCTIGQRFLTHS